MILRMITTLSVLNVYFHYLKKSGMVISLNLASIISIPKKRDLSDCNNYRGISLINVGLKILSKLSLKEYRTMLFLME